MLIILESESKKNKIKRPNKQINKLMDVFINLIVGIFHNVYIYPTIMLCTLNIIQFYFPIILQ